MSGTLWAHHRAPTPNVLSGGSVRPGGRARFRPLLCAVRKKESPPTQRTKRTNTNYNHRHTPHCRSTAREGVGRVWSWGRMAWLDRVSPAYTLLPPSSRSPFWLKGDRTLAVFVPTHPHLGRAGEFRHPSVAGRGLGSQPTAAALSWGQRPEPQGHSTSPCCSG